jgi:hypothetical protein
MKIDQMKLQKWQEVVQFASDPERLSMLEMVLVQNGTGAIVTEVQPQHQPSRPVAGTAVLTRWKEGTQIRAIAKAALGCETPFTGYELAAKMQDAGYKFTTDRPGVTVTDVLRGPLKDVVVRVFKKGQGSEPTHFESFLP